jgi:hypothetical protein
VRSVRAFRRGAGYRMRSLPTRPESQTGRDRFLTEPFPPRYGTLPSGLFAVVYTIGITEKAVVHYLAAQPGTLGSGVLNALRLSLLSGASAQAAIDKVPVGLILRSTDHPSEDHEHREADHRQKFLHYRLLTQLGSFALCCFGKPARAPGAASHNSPSVNDEEVTVCSPPKDLSSPMPGPRTVHARPSRAWRPVIGSLLFRRISWARE